MKFRLLFTISILSLLGVACSDKFVDENIPYDSFYEREEGGGNNYSYEYVDLGPYEDGFNFDYVPEEVAPVSKSTDDDVVISADKGIVITFQAGAESGIYGEDSDMYLHCGVMVEGQWMLVPAEWDENLEKCKFKSDPNGSNVWQIRITPTLREFFGSGDTPVEKLGLIVRSADGSKKGLEQDFFVDVEDDGFTGFTPAPIIEKAMDGSWKYGINVIDDTSVAFVLYDKDKNGARKDYAHIVGDFNNWTLSNEMTSQMYRDNAAGVWWQQISGLEPNREYRFQYYIGTETDGSMRLADPYSEKILDPNNDKWIPAWTYDEDMTYPEKGAIGVVTVFSTTRDNFNWTAQNPDIDKRNLIIYELLIRDFTDEGDINAVKAKLDYIEGLGVNAIQLMPIQEFDGNDSWGYNPCFFFAMDKAYGTQTDYKEFIDECHRRGIAVILDVVYNHSTGAHPFAKLYWNSAKNETAANNPYYNVTAPHPYSVFHDYNHESTLVQEFVKRNLQFLIEEYNIDGFRFDLTKGFTQRECDESTASNKDDGRIAVLKGYNDAIKAVDQNAYVILEHFCSVAEEKELANAGMMMWRNAVHPFSQSAMGYPTDSSFKMISTQDTDMPFGGWVGFMESHDEERASFKQYKYGNGYLTTDLNSRMKQLATNAAFGMLTPGPKMIWQFGEVGYDYSINSNKANTEIHEDNRTGRKAIRWDYFEEPARRGLYDDYAMFLELREEHPDLFVQDVNWWNVEQSKIEEGEVWFWGYDEQNCRAIRLVANGKTLVLLGNFTNNEIPANYDFGSSGPWYNYETGVQVTGRPNVPANDFIIVATFQNN